MTNPTDPTTIRQRAEAATAGPYTVKQFAPDKVAIEAPTIARMCVLHATGRRNIRECLDDATFIVTALNTFLSLRTRLAETEADRDRLAELVKQQQADIELMRAGLIEDRPECAECERLMAVVEKCQTALRLMLDAELYATGEGVYLFAESDTAGGHAAVEAAQAALATRPAADAGKEQE